MKCSYRQILFNVYQCQLKAYEIVLTYLVLSVDCLSVILSIALSKKKRNLMAVSPRHIYHQCSVSL